MKCSLSKLGNLSKSSKEIEVVQQTGHAIQPGDRCAIRNSARIRYDLSVVETEHIVLSTEAERVSVRVDLNMDQKGILVHTHSMILLQESDERSD